MIARATRNIQLSFSAAGLSRCSGDLAERAQAIDECLTPVDDPRPVAIALSNQRESVVWGAPERTTSGSVIVYNAAGQPTSARCEPEGWRLFWLSVPGWE